MRFSKHKKERFLALLEPYKELLYRYCKNMLWDKNDVEDTLQSAVMNAYRSFDKFAEETNFRAWIFKFLTNTIFNFNKRHERINTFEVKMDPDHIEAVSEMFEKEIVYHEILNAPEMFFDRLSSQIKDSLLLLSNAERSVFLLRSIGELSYKEIADVLKIPMGTVMSHLSRARARLRESLCDYAKEMKSASE